MADPKCMDLAGGRLDIVRVLVMLVVQFVQHGQVCTLWCVCVCVRACVCACVHACVWGGGGEWRVCVCVNVL